MITVCLFVDFEAAAFSGRFRPLIPLYFCHLFRFIPATISRAICHPLAGNSPQVENGRGITFVR
jgi:hypothetical protein